MDHDLECLRQKYIQEYKEEEENSLILDVPRTKTEYYFVLKEARDMIWEVLRKKLYKKYTQLIITVSCK